MSLLAQHTEKKALKVLANSLRFFEHTDLLFISAEDAHKAREAENTIKAIIESNGYQSVYKKGKGTRIFKNKQKHYESELF